MAHRVRRARERLQLAERVLGGVDQLDLAARGALERLVRRNPECVDRFRRVVRRLLPVWRQPDEEASIEAPRAAGCGHPVADIAELARRDIEVVLLEKLDEWPLTIAS